MRVYEVLKHPERGWKAVKQGFSWPAFFFGWVWALTKRLWLIAFGGFLAAVAPEVIGLSFADTTVFWWKSATLIYLAMVLAGFGTWGNRCVSDSLVGKGFASVCRVEARTRRAAVARVRASSDLSEVAVSPRGNLATYLPGVAVFSITVFLVSLKTAFPFYWIPSPTMLDTLQIGDRVLVSRFAYSSSEPEVGDVVVFLVPEEIRGYDPDKPVWIKRIVGAGGETVGIDGGPEGGRLLLDGNPVDDPPFFARNRYVPMSFGGKTYEATEIPEGHVMVFGDNSRNSYDSRYWGSFPEDRLIGKVVFRFWPPSRFGSIVGKPHSTVE